MTGHSTIVRCLLVTIGTGISVPVLAQSGSYSAPAVINRPAEARVRISDSQDVRPPNRQASQSGEASRWPRGTYQQPESRQRHDSAPTTWTAPRTFSDQGIRVARPNALQVRRPARPVRFPQVVESQTSRQRLLPPNSPPPKNWSAPAALTKPGYSRLDDVATVSHSTTAAPDASVNSIATTAPHEHVAQTSLSSNVGVWQNADAVPSAACSGCDSDSSCGCRSTFLEQLHPETEFFVRGWLAQGFTFNPDSPRNNFNLPTTFNDRANEYQLNQLYVSMGIEAEESAVDWDLGAQVDLLYGTDYFFTTSLGLETHDDGTPRWNSDGPRNGGGAALYGLAMPQLFAEVWAPIGNGVRMKFGHFYTTLGYETVTAPDNFFYSHSYTMQYGEPFTHTGFLATSEVADGVTVHGGFTRGWDNWEDPDSDLSFLGGVQLDWDRTSLAYAVHVGDEDVVGDDTRSTYSLVLTHHLNDQWRYIFQHDLGYQQNGQPISLGTAKWYGINQYLIVDLCDTLSIGNRFEWFRDHNNARVLGAPAEGGNYFNYTFGLNWRPMPNMVVRPELRWDWSDVVPPFGLTGVYDDFSDKNQFTLGTDVILSF